MLGTLIVLILIALAVTAVVWVRNSDSDFAVAIRAQIPFLQRKAADKLDSVQAEVDAADAAQGSSVKYGRMNLYQLQKMLAANEIKMRHAQEEVEDDNKALALANGNDDKETFDGLVEDLNQDTAYVNDLVADRADMVASLKAVEVRQDEEAAKQRAIQSEGDRLVSHTLRDQMITRANEEAAGLVTNGAEEHLKAARRIADRAEGDAIASKAAAEGLTPGERIEKKKESYLKAAKQGEGVNADDLWAKMTAAKTAAKK